ncbi:MAG: hypothetical protein HYY04_09820 [Chloroflexi bacterium]|nr:hypothetical protein [Chloroflexota bacterium]
MNRRLAQREPVELADVGEVDHDRSVFEHNRVGEELGLRRLLGMEARRIQVDRRRVGSQVEADGSRAGDPLEALGEDGDGSGTG